MDKSQEIKIRDNDGRREVLDPVRRRYVALTPEEWVRQQVIQYLHHGCGYPLELMQVEAAIALNGLTKRCDVVVYDASVHPVMIVETKKTEVPINQKVIDQACRYNLVLHVPYLMLSNGRQTVCLRVGREEPHLVQVAVPMWEELRQCR
ncbi:MAG: type I restriction enzyme HsdR N-terminal domain-containing protein [Bacteroidales bacterium]|nr:type I restriction enzyme HsdR N-terminal domain-containing protein [Bacteroidales bacterium]